MIQITLAHSDLARVRFAHSPVNELVASLRVLQDPSRQPMYGRWLSSVRGPLGGLRLELLTALAPTGRYLPAFLLPPPTRPWGELAEELERVAFTWPTLSVDCCAVDQPALIYPPRGLAGLWPDRHLEQTNPLSALIGRTRATLLATLALPKTTTQLAEQLQLSPAAVSQHLKILKDTALVTARRRGRMVLYQRTPAAAALLAASRSDQAAG